MTSYDKMFIKFYMKTQANLEEKSKTLSLPNIIIIIVTETILSWPENRQISHVKLVVSIKAVYKDTL